MPLDPSTIVLPIVVTGFIALVTLTIVVIVVGRLIRLARGGPAADRLREHLLQQQRAGRGTSGSRPAHQRMLLDQQVQQQMRNDAADPGPPPS